MVVLVVVVFGVSGCRDVGVLVGRRALGGRHGWQVLKGVKKGVGNILSLHDAALDTP